MENKLNMIEPEIEQTWEKFADAAKKAGFRDGAADGQESIFQDSFNQGYLEGFKNGFSLGKHKGILRVKSQDALESNVHLQNSRSGCCQLCSNEQLLKTGTINEITQIQTKFINSLLTQLHSRQSK